MVRPLPPVEPPPAGWNGNPKRWKDRIMHEEPASHEIRIVSPDSIFRGKTYSDLLSDWFNWLLTTDPEKHNTGPVVFLRSIDIPSAHVDANITEPDKAPDLSISNAYTDDDDFPRKYPNTPNIMVGGDKLQIYTDQAVFAPIIVSYAEASKPYVDWGLMQELTGLIIDNGDNPPANDQLTIDGEPVVIDSNNNDNENMTQFRVVSPIFTAVVPETDYGRSAKDFLETSFPPGHYDVMVEGYFVLIKFGEGTYQLHSKATSGREKPGYYFSEYMYEIEVNDRQKRPLRPARNEALIRMKLYEKVKMGEVDTEKAKEMGRKVGVDVPS